MLAEISLLEGLLYAVLIVGLIVLILIAFGRRL